MIDDLKIFLAVDKSVSFENNMSNIGLYPLESSFFKKLYLENLPYGRKLEILTGILSCFSDDISRLDPHTDDERILKARCISQLANLQKILEDEVVKNKEACASY